MNHEDCCNAELLDEWEVAGTTYGIDSDGCLLVREFDYFDNPYWSKSIMGGDLKSRIVLYRLADVLRESAKATVADDSIGEHVEYDWPGVGPAHPYYVKRSALHYVCESRSPKGLVCTLDPDHDGDHVAHTGKGMLARWPQK